MPDEIASVADDIATWVLVGIITMLAADGMAIMADVIAIGLCFLS